MTLKNDANFKEKLTCGFKYDMKDLVNFHSKFRKFHFDGLLLSKVYEFWAKKYRGVIFHDTEQWCKVWINPDFVVSQMAWGIGWSLIRTLKSLKNCTLMGCFCPKHMFQLKNFKGIKCRDTEGWYKA